MCEASVDSRETRPPHCDGFGRSVHEHLRSVHEYQVFITAMCVVMVIRKLGKNCIQTNRDKLDVLRHIIKNVSERLVQLIESRLQSRKGFVCQ
jgi:hypothetical protein